MQGLEHQGGRQQALRSGPVYVLLQGIPCCLTEVQLAAMADNAPGLDYVNMYNPCDPGFAVFVFRTAPGAGPALILDAAEKLPLSLRLTWCRKLQRPSTPITSSSAIC